MSTRSNVQRKRRARKRMEAWAKRFPYRFDYSTPNPRVVIFPISPLEFYHVIEEVVIPARPE